MDLPAFRESKGMSQDDLASALGLRSKSYISGIESGAIVCPLRLALRIQQFTDGAVLAETLVSPEDRALLAVAATPQAAPEAEVTA